MEDYVENLNVKIWLEDGVLHCIYKKDCIIALQSAQEVVALREKYQNGKSYPAIAYLSKMGAFTPDARKYLAVNGYNGIEKLAVVTTTPFAAFIGNIFITVDKPLKPTRLFKTKDEAIKWLKES